jgi:hypothetical protein
MYVRALKRLGLDRSGGAMENQATSATRIRRRPGCEAKYKLMVTLKV